MAVMNPVMGPPMGPTTIGTVEYIGASIDPDVVLWAGAIRASGGSIPDDDLLLASQFVAAERASGAYALTDDYWPLWLPTAIAARTSLKQRRLMTLTGSPVFTANRDYTFNGSNQYGDTGFIPSTHAIAYTADRQRIGVYERTNVSGDSISAGASPATNNRVTIQPRVTSTAMVGNLNTSSATPTFTIAADSRGLSVVSRDASATTVRGYKNGVRLTDATGQTAGSNIQGIALWLGGNNANGSVNKPRACSLGFAVIGAPLSDAQELAQYNNVQAWAAAKGANV